MDWKRFIRDEIAEYQENIDSIPYIEKRIRDCEDDKKAIRASSPSGMPHGSSGAPADDNWARIIVEEDIAIGRLCTVRRQIAKVERGLARLDERSRDILVQMSCHKYGDDVVDKLCETYAIEKATLYRLWNEASKKYKVIQFGHE